MVLILFTMHDSDTAVICTKFQNDWYTGISVIDVRDSGRYELIRCVSDILQQPSGACPTNDISIEFEARWKYIVL